MTRKKKAWTITGSIIGGLVAIIGLFLIIWYCADTYPAFYEKTQKEFSIPGLSDGFTPQGMACLDDNSTFLMSGYMHNGSQSRIYLVNATDQTTSKFVTLLHEDGSSFFGHMGGIAAYGDTVWVSSEDNLYRLSVTDIQNASNGTTVMIKDHFDTQTGASFCFVQNDTLWVGEFYREKNYQTDSSHHLTMPSGKTHHSFVFAYDIDENKEFGLKSTTPTKILSVTDYVQGIAISNSGKIVLSTSYSLPNSKILIYDDVLTKTNDTVYQMNGSDIPVWYLDSANLLETIDAPCMSEELAYVNGRIYINFESGCKKYKLFVREQLTNVYSFELA